MAAIDDLGTALAAEDVAIDKLVVLAQNIPSLQQAAFDAGKASNDAALAQMQADVQAHTDAIVAALPATPAP